MIRIVAGLALGTLAAMAASADTYGRHERVQVLATVGIEIDSRLDPAAATSTLRAVDVKYFNKDGGMWVRFTIDNGGVLPGSRLTVERPVLKDVRVRQRDGSVEHRPTIELPLCVGRARLDTRLSLSDRSNYTAPLTLGAADIAKLGAVDAAREYTVEPMCEQPRDARPLPARDSGRTVIEAPPPVPVPRGNARFACDGRQYCSEMNSRAEAEFFVANCPDTKMDGNHDGKPCENDSRW